MRFNSHSTFKHSSGRFDSKQNRFVIGATPQLKMKCPGVARIPWKEIGRLEERGKERGAH